MNNLCPFQQLDNGWWECPQCGFVFKGKCEGAPNKRCDNPPNLTPILIRLAELTNHPEIIDQPKAYGPAVQIWAAGIVHHSKGGRSVRQTEPFETRDDAEVEECLTLCRENVCGKHQGGICKPRCGQGMILAVKTRMASEGCPWAGNRDHGKQW